MPGKSRHPKKTEEIRVPGEKLEPWSQEAEGSGVPAKAKHTSPSSWMANQDLDSTYVWAELGRES